MLASAFVKGLLWYLPRCRGCGESRENSRSSYTSQSQLTMKSNTHDLWPQLCVRPKWHPIPFKLHCFWPRPMGLMSKVVRYIGNRVSFGILSVSDSYAMSFALRVWWSISLCWHTENLSFYQHVWVGVCVSVLCCVYNLSVDLICDVEPCFCYQVIRLSWQDEDWTRI